MKYMHLILYLILALMLPALCVAEDSPMVVGPGGTVLKLHSGTYGEHFPGGVEADPESNVLLLDILRPSGTERLLVPGTENRDAESISALYFGKESGLTYILWEGLVSGIHPFLYLLSFNGTQWSEVIPIAGSVFADKGAAHLVIMPESDPQPKAAPMESVARRTVIYVAWQEITPSGGEAFLVPVVLENGEYIGWRQVFNLSKLTDTDPAGPKDLFPRSVMDPNLQDMITIQPSSKGNAVVVGFINHDTGRFMTLEFEMLPLALTALVRQVESLIVGYAETADSVDDLITQAQAGLLDAGAEFHPSVLEYLANQLRDLLAEHSTVAAATAPPVLEKIGAMMIDVGARVRRKGLVDLEPLGIYGLSRSLDGSADHHHLKVSLVAELDAPNVEGPATLYLSRTGDNALVVWSSDDTVFYRETQSGLWGEMQSVALQEGIGQEAVYQILAQRTLNR